MPKALSTVGDRQRFCQEQRPVLAEQVSGMEHDAFHVPVSSNKTLEAAFNGQARTRRPSASTAVAARARPRGPRAGPSPPTTAGETGCGRPPTAAAAAAADKPAQAEPLACIPTRMLSVPSVAVSGMAIDSCIFARRLAAGCPCRRRKGQVCRTRAHRPRRCHGLRFARSRPGVRSRTTKSLRSRGRPGARVAPSADEPERPDQRRRPEAVDQREWT